jgi:hypothetical protein
MYVPTYIHRSGHGAKFDKSPKLIPRIKIVVKEELPNSKILIDL